MPYAKWAVIPFRNQMLARYDMKLRLKTLGITRFIDASKTKVMSALIPGGQRKVVLLGSEPLEDVDKFEYLGSMFIEDGQGTE